MICLNLSFWSDEKVFRGRLRNRKIQPYLPARQAATSCSPLDNAENLQRICRTIANNASFQARHDPLLRILSARLTARNARALSGSVAPTPVMPQYPLGIGWSRKPHACSRLLMGNTGMPVCLPFYQVVGVVRDPRETMSKSEGDDDLYIREARSKPPTLHIRLESLDHHQKKVVVNGRIGKSAISWLDIGTGRRSRLKTPGFGLASAAETFRNSVPGLCCAAVCGLFRAPSTSCRQWCVLDKPARTGLWPVKRPVESHPRPGECTRQALLGYLSLLALCRDAKSDERRLKCLGMG